MKPQFSISTLLISTAFVAISLGGWIAIDKSITRPVNYLEYLILAPFCVPFAFCGYAIGQRRVSILLAIVFAITEAVAVPIAIWADKL